MKRVIFIVIGLLAAACGHTDNDVATPTPSPTPVPALEGGLYEASNVQLVRDDCFEFGQWDNGTRFGVDVEDGLVTVSAVYEMDVVTASTLSGELTSTNTHPDFDCTSQTSVLLDATVLADNRFEWTVDYARHVVQGTQCDLANTPCTSLIVMTLSR